MKLADAIGAQCVRFPGHGDGGGYDLIQAARFIAMYRDELTAKPAAAPRRRFLLVLKLGADSKEELLQDLKEIHRRIYFDELRGECLSGGCAAGYTLELTEDPTVTHDSYFEAIKNL